jgi:hypothetical protein
MTELQPAFLDHIDRIWVNADSNCTLALRMNE